MLAVTITEPGNLVVGEVGDPTPEPGEVLVRTVAAGICGSDVEMLAGQRPPEYTRYPVVPGHEWTGVVHALGDGVEGVQTGTHVVASGIRGCRRCDRCREGRSNLCSTGYSETGFTEPGGWAGYLRVPADLLFELTVPAGVDPALAALLEPAACVAGGLLVGGVPLRPGQHVAVVGTGTLSLIGVQLLAATKPASLTVVGASPSAIELARHWGATDIVSPDEAATDGWTADADLVFEAGSRPASARLALAAARRGGTVVLEGLPGEPDPDADLSAIPLANLHVQGVFGAQPSAWAAVVELFGAGLLDLAPLVSHRIPLAEVQRAFDLLDNRPRDLRKILLMP